MKFKCLFLACLILSVSPLVGCNRNNDRIPVYFETTPTPDPTPAPTPTPLPRPTPEPTEDLTGKARSVFTGIYIDEEIASRRPVAVVINNYRRAIPQSGIGSADIHFEVLAEGDITRIVSVFQSESSENIGPVRSTRNYFTDFAFCSDAILVHHGGSPQGYESIRRFSLNNLDGMRLEGTTFWRDPERRANRGMEHSSMTAVSLIMEAAEKAGYRMELSEDYTPMWNFFTRFTIPYGGHFSNRVVVPFSQSQRSTFVYDFRTREYRRYQGDVPHIDEETGEQLTFTNILVQLTRIIVIDAVGRRQVDLVGSGNGYLITAGHYIPVTWRKESIDSPTQWFDEQGNPLRLNRGRTWICVFSENGTVIFE